MEIHSDFTQNLAQLFTSCLIPISLWPSACDSSAEDKTRSPTNYVFYRDEHPKLKQNIYSISSSDYQIQFAVCIQWENLSIPLKVLMCYDLWYTAAYARARI